MQRAIVTLLILPILTLLALMPVQAQNNIPANDPGILARLAPEQEQICTFEPTFRDAFYYKDADEFRKKGGFRAKTASIQVDYVGSWSQEARNAFEYAMTIWESHIDSEVPIKIEANWIALEGNTLGSAGPTLIYPINNVWYPIAQASAIEGQDLLAGNQFGVEHDIVVNMNSSFGSWYYETDANTPGGFIDFVTVVIHEIGHGLGFTGSMRGDPDTEIAEWGLGDPVRPYVYDTFIEDGFSQSVLNEIIYPNPSNALYNAVTSDDLYFIGDLANEAYENLPVPIYAPQPWDPGSSYSHLDLNTFEDTENALMRPQIDNAFAIHSPGPVMCGIFADTGWPLGGGCFAELGAEAIVEVDDTEIDFGVTNVNDRLDTTIVISNSIDSENALVARVDLSSQTSAFSLNNSNSAIFLNIEPGESQEIQVTYRPRSARKDSVNIRIYHNDAIRENPILITLKGDALEENRVVELEQNYPNPFNPYTNISYKLPQSSYVKLQIFDIAGKLVQTVVDGEQSRGRNVHRVQADDWASGVYIYRIIVEGRVETRKLMLVK